MFCACRNIDHLVSHQPPSAFNGDEDLIFMALDVVEEANGARYRVWGTTQDGTSVLLTVQDFEPYFYIAAPKRLVTLQQGGVAADFEPETQDIAINWDQEQPLLRTLCGLFNQTLSPDSRIQRIEPVHRRPIMYYRPGYPDGEIYLKLTLPPGGSTKRAGTAVINTMTNATGLRNRGIIWRDYTLYENEVSPLQRFLADVPVSGGAWLCIPPAAGAGGAAAGIHTPVKTAGGASGSGISTTGASISAAGGYSIISNQYRVASTAIEAVAPWRALVCLTPDATQLSDSAWSPFSTTMANRGLQQPSAAAQHAAELAKRGDIAPLKILVMDVCVASRDGVERAPVPENGDPIVAISCAFMDNSSRKGEGEAAGGATKGTLSDQEEEREGSRSEILSDFEGVTGEEGEDEAGSGVQIVSASTAVVVGAPTSSAKKKSSSAAGVHDGRPQKVVFVLAPQQMQNAAGAAAKERYSDAEVLFFSTEVELLLTWQDYVVRSDPDVIALFQVKDTLDAILKRFKALGLGRSGNAGRGLGALKLSRYNQNNAKEVQIRRITMYSAAWVRSQSRMSSTSNQETFKADIDGRLVIDVLRQVLTSSNLASFSLVDCVQSLLGETMEVLGAHTLAALAGLTVSEQNGAMPAAATALRLARYSLRRTSCVHALLGRLATIPEAIEMARATGLTIAQVTYNAQMIRTWSLILRVAQRQAVIIQSREETTPLSEHTFILHPVEAGTTGLHRKPVAILDFASLYPSIYRAYNLCYTTLVHQDDEKLFNPEDLIVTSTGAKFVRPGVRNGMVPGILGALVSARAATRAQLATATTPAQRAVLDSRQKALKVTANALYGFTGAQASPLQCVQLADSCLAYGAQSCRRAKEVLEAAAMSGELGPGGRDAKVIYGHTDSLFLLLPAAGDVATAIQTGHIAAKVVTATFPPPLELKFERVCAPLMLLHVNRYAGKAFEKESDILRGGDLIVKGLKSMWRQTAPILRHILHGSLVRILMQDDVQGAVTFAEKQIYRLLSGNVEINELVMTGGLWRVTGEQVGRAAAAEEGFEGGSYAASGSGGTAGSNTNTDPEVRGPHASLAVRLTQRDPGRAFVLGERLQYVLTAGHKLQDDAAEDPLTAARQGLRPDYQLYYKNKIQKPLSELFSTCLNQSQLQSLLSGPHTLVKVDLPAGQSGGSGGAQTAGGGLGPISPPPGKGRGRGGGNGASGSTPGSASKQLGMMAFFKANARCLGCKRPMSSFKGPIEDAPGLCDSCSGQEGKWQEVYMSIQADAGDTEARQTAAYAACRQCDSGLVSQPVLCDNGECPVTYARLSTEKMLCGATQSLRRLDIF